MIAHTVAQGECLYSIAGKYGLPWTTIWNHPQNAGLKQKRKDPNVLLSGDLVMVPDKQLREESCPTDAKYSFQVNIPQTKLRLQMLDRNHQPRAGLNYSVSIDGTVHTGTTDSEGRIEEPIPPDASKAHLCLQDGDNTEQYDIDLGHVNPVDHETGGEQRLENLGLGKGMDPKVALRWFQKKYGLNQSGELDSQTLDKLKSIHGC
jgi:hypothetical protein